MIPRGINRRHLAYTGAAVAIIGVTAISHNATYTVGTVAGRTFYVAPSGNDAASGLSTGTPFRTIGRCAAVVAPGETCALLAGTYHETVTPTNDGTASEPITYTTYQGANVTIDGADPITTWVAGPQSTYTATVALPTAGYHDTGFWANQVFVDGVMVQEARYPQDTGTLMNPSDGWAQSGSTSNHIADSGLTFPVDSLQGATVHLRGSFAWSAQSRAVTGNGPGSLDFGDTSACAAGKLAAGPQTRWFVSGLPRTTLLTYAGAWAYTPATTTLFLRLPSDANPTSGHTIEAKQRNYAFDLSGHSHIVVDGFALFASTITTTATSHDNTLENLTVTYPSHFVSIPSTPDGCPYAGHTFDSGIVLSGTNELLQGSTITKSAGGGVVADGVGISVTNNLIHDVDYSATYAVGVQLRISQGISVTHNTVYNTGRDGIKMGLATNGQSAPRNATSIAHNLIYNWGMMTTDNGGFYTCCALDGSAVSVDHNWVHDSQSGSEIDDIFGSNNAGLYFDNQDINFLAHHNVVYNAQTAIFFNGQNVTAAGNRSYNNTLPSNLQQSMGTSGDVTGAAFRNNIAPQGWNGTVPNSNNLSVNPTYVNGPGHNYALAPGDTLATDKGTLVTGITPAGDSHPDIGAYDHTDPFVWVPGCEFNNAVCADPAAPGLNPTP